MQQAKVCHFSSDFCHQRRPVMGRSAESIISSIMLLAKATSEVDQVKFEHVEAGRAEFFAFCEQDQAAGYVRAEMVEVWWYWVATTAKI
ncbi:hypothetical protein BpHYR1_014980 [Brachionus plicatilis]|uniref:Uncharacterized protein n=1 Tax=Brachionus plicatilis TaxID=10195 RepID=A0A3M7SWF1_BRAPC|nr:hypothetical protein BpHYR1_014980 [Brachionus plicatilis]